MVWENRPNMNTNNIWFPKVIQIRIWILVFCLKYSNNIWMTNYLITSAPNDLQWPPMTSNDLQWPQISSNDLHWHPMASNDLFLAIFWLFGYFWLFLTISDYYWLFLTISDWPTDHLTTWQIDKKGFRLIWFNFQWTKMNFEELEWT